MNHFEYLLTQAVSSHIIAVISSNYWFPRSSVAHESSILKSFFITLKKYRKNALIKKFVFQN